MSNHSHLNNSNPQSNPQPISPISEALLNLIQTVEEHHSRAPGTLGMTERESARQREFNTLVREHGMEGAIERWVERFWVEIEGEWEGREWTTDFEDESEDESEEESEPDTETESDSEFEPESEWENESDSDFSSSTSTNSSSDSSSESGGAPLRTIKQEFLNFTRTWTLLSLSPWSTASAPPEPESEAKSEPIDPACPIYHCDNCEGYIADFGPFFSSPSFSPPPHPPHPPKYPKNLLHLHPIPPPHLPPRLSPTFPRSRLNLRQASYSAENSQVSSKHGEELVL